MKKKLFTFILVSLLSVAGFAQTYYVDGISGNDSLDGKSATPMKTISAALAKVSEGDTIWISSATYRETLTLTCSGITLSAKPNANVLIKGSELITSWIFDQGSVWQTTWTVNSQQVFVDGIPLQQIGVNSPFHIVQNGESKARMPSVGTGLADMFAGSFYYDETASKLYVWLSDSTDPQTHKVEASVRNTVLRANNATLHDIQLIDLQFYHSNGTSQGNSFLAGVSGLNWTVNHCIFSDGDFGGMAITGEGHQIINCTFDRNGDLGLQIHGGSTSPRSPQNILVSGCQTNYNNYRHFRTDWHAGGMKNIPNVTQVIISQCRSSFNDGPGIWFDGACDSILIDRCTVTDNSKAGIFYEISDNAVISNNLVLRNKRQGIYVASSDNVRVLNNTIDSNWVGIAFHGMPRAAHPSLANNIAQNNILSRNDIADFVMYIDSTTAPAPGNGNSSDYNLFYRQDGTVKIAYTPHTGYQVNYGNLATFSASTGMEQHSHYGDPIYTAPDADIFSLILGSPAIDSAAHSPDLGILDILGHPRRSGNQVDIGAYEYIDNAVTTDADINPVRSLLSQNHPNPFSTSTTITFNATETDHCSLKIYDITGREIAVLLNGIIPAGRHQIEWNGTNAAGQQLGKGVYFYQLKVGKHFMETKKMVLIR